jgi:hypothetical protein
VKKFLLAVAFTAVFAGGAMAQSSNSGLAPRDPPFGKGNPGNDTMDEPSSAGSGHSYSSSDQSIPPRDPPFGKGNLSNDTMHEPNSAGSAYSHPPSDQSVPRDPPFGKGNAGNDTMHEPSSADIRGVSGDTPKPKKAKTKSAMKKDNTRKDTAPK